MEIDEESKSNTEEQQQQQVSPPPPPPLPSTECRTSTNEKKEKIDGIEEEEEEEEEIEGEEGEIKSTSFRSPFSYPSNWGNITDTNYENRLEYINTMNKLFNENVDGNNDMLLEQSFYEQHIKKTNKESFGMCFACIFCDKKFEEKKYAEKHQKLKHSEKIVEFIEQDKFVEKAKNIFLNDPLRYVPIEKERIRKNKSNMRDNSGNYNNNNSFKRRSFYSYRDPDDNSVVSSKSKGKSLINYGDI